MVQTVKSTLSGKWVIKVSVYKFDAEQLRKLADKLDELNSKAEIGEQFELAMRHLKAGRDSVKTPGKKRVMATKRRKK